MKKNRVLRAAFYAAGLAAGIAVLAAGIILTGIGAAMSLDMRLIPNPGDGIVQALADCFKKPVGLTARFKNTHEII